MTSTADSLHKLMAASAALHQCICFSYVEDAGFHAHDFSIEPDETVGRFIAKVRAVEAQRAGERRIASVEIQIPFTAASAREVAEFERRLLDRAFEMAIEIAGTADVEASVDSWAEAE